MRPTIFDRPIMPRAPRELVACARACHARGDGVRAILETCYGVAFPEEVFVILEHHDDVASHMPPWALADLAKVDDLSDVWMGAVAEVYAADRTLVPVSPASGMLCYRLDELAAGRSTVYEVPRSKFEGLDDYVEAQRVGDSLLAVWHDNAVAAAAAAEAEYASPGNRGAGSIDRDEVEWRHATVAAMEALQRELAMR